MALNRFLSTDTSSVKVEVTNPVLRTDGSGFTLTTSDTAAQASLNLSNLMLNLSASDRARANITSAVTGRQLGGAIEGVGAVETTMCRALLNGERLTFDRAGVTLGVASTSASDDGSPAGIGAQTVLVLYIDMAGDEQTAFATLNGTTEVSLGVTGQIVLRVLSASVGSNGANVGLIYAGDFNGTWGAVTAGKPTGIYMAVGAGTNISACSWAMPPNGKCIAFTEASVASDAVSKNDGLVIQAYSHAFVGPNPVTLAANRVHCIGGFNFGLQAFPCIFPGGVIEFTVRSDMSVNIAVAITAVDIDLTVYPNAS